VGSFCHDRSKLYQQLHMFHIQVFKAVRQLGIEFQNAMKRSTSSDDSDSPPPLKRPKKQIKFSSKAPVDPESFGHWLVDHGLAEKIRENFSIYIKEAQEYFDNDRTIGQDDETYYRNKRYTNKKRKKKFKSGNPYTIK
jgi:Zn-finger nucleic acid-binding protein